MFKNVHLGNDQYSDFEEEQNKKIEEERQQKMDRLIEISVTCNSMLKILNRLNEDVNRIEREIQMNHNDVKDNLKEICSIVDNIDDKINNN